MVVPGIGERFGAEKLAGAPVEAVGGAVLSEHQRTFPPAPGGELPGEVRRPALGDAGDQARFHRREILRPGDGELEVLVHAHAHVADRAGLQRLRHDAFVVPDDFVFRRLLKDFAAKRRDEPVVDADVVAPIEPERGFVVEPVPGELADRAGRFRLPPLPGLRPYAQFMVRPAVGRTILHAVCETFQVGLHRAASYAASKRLSRIGKSRARLDGRDLTRHNALLDVRPWSGAEP